MRENIATAMIVISLAGSGFLTGYHEGKRAADRWYAQQITAIRIQEFKRGHSCGIAETEFLFTHIAGPDPVRIIDVVPGDCAVDQPR